MHRHSPLESWIDFLMSIKESPEGGESSTKVGPIVFTYALFLLGNVYYKNRHFCR